MKRIFLTSGLVLCMACPAFAVDNPSGVDIAPDAETSCTVGTLEGYNGTSTLTAQWNPIWHRITLNEDDYDATTNANGIGVTTSNIGTDGDNLTTANTLYSEQGTSGVYKGFTGTVQAGTFALTNFTDDDVIATFPTGKDVSYSITNVRPTGATGSPTFPEITRATRRFNGFWKLVNDTNTQMVTDEGVLTEAGKTAASSSDIDQTWNAEYKCATPTFDNVTGTNSTTPVWAGYTFKGYGTSDTDPGAGSYVTPGCITENTTLFAFWQAQQFHITYTCGTPSGTTSFSTTGGYGYTGANNQNVVSDAINMDGSYTLAANEGSCVLPGYHFVGWSCANLTGTPTLPEDAQTKTYFAAGATGTYSYAGDIICNAVWAANTITLVSNNGFGGADTDAGSCSYDGTITMPSQPSRPGYEFTGWEVVSSPAQQLQEQP